MMMGSAVTGGSMFGNLIHDLRSAARSLWRHRGFSAAAIAILTIGIAASTGLFAVLDALVLHPLPYAEADRLARVRLVPASGSPHPAAVTADEFLALRRTATLDDAYLRSSFTKTLGGAAFPESVWTEYYTGNAPRVLGLQPRLGRAFTEAEAPVGSPAAHVALLTDGFWRRHFGAAPGAIGQTLRLDGEPFTIIGIMPADYSMDLTDIVLPLPMTFDASATWAVTVRVKRGLSLATAEGDIQRLFARFAQARPQAVPRGARVQLSRLVDEERGAGHVPVISLLFGATALLLLIGCANVTILLLARGRHRRFEMAMRDALGAGRGRLVSLLLCEALVITVMASALALLLAHDLLPRLLDGMPGVVAQRAGRILVGPAAILFAGVVTAVATIVAGLWPAIAVSRTRSNAMRAAMATRSASDSGGWSTGVLVAAQVVIAVLLLAGTGAAVRDLIELYRAPAGYDPARVTAAQIYLPEGRYDAWPQRVALYERLRSEVAKERRVERSTISLIPTGPPPRTGVAGRVVAAGGSDDEREVLIHSVASDYFATLKMPLVRGRAWTEPDDERAAPVAVINETMARRLWPGADPIGQRVRDRSFLERRPQWVLNAPGRDGWFEVIGVIKDAPNQGLREPVAAALYYPYTAALSDVAVLLVRTTGDPVAAERDLRTAVARADSALPIIRFLPSEGFLGWTQARLVSGILIGLAGLALLLAAFGLFSVAAYTIADRTREFGIRIALGATPATVWRAAMRPVAIAVVFGLGAGMALSVTLGAVVARWSIRNLADPIVLAAAAVTLLTATLAATLIPARRATSIAPMAALRAE